MKNARLTAVVLLSWSSWSAAADDAVASYEETLGEVYGFTMALPHTFAWCVEKYPDIRLPLNEALATWHERYDGLIAELERRLLVVLGSSGEVPHEEQAGFLKALQEKVGTELRASLDKSPGEQMRMSCLVLPAGIETAALDVEKKFPEKLKLIRAHEEKPAASSNR